MKVASLAALWVVNEAGQSADLMATSMVLLKVDAMVVEKVETLVAIWVATLAAR